MACTSQVSSTWLNSVCTGPQMSVNWCHRKHPLRGLKVKHCFHKYVQKHLVSSLEKYFKVAKEKIHESGTVFFYFKKLISPKVLYPMMLSCGPEFAEAEWNEIWLSQKDVRGIQSLCLFVHVKVLTLSLRGCGDLMLFRLISLPSPPWRPVVVAIPASCSLLCCIHIALMIMGVDSCLMQ